LSQEDADNPYSPPTGDDLAARTAHGYKVALVERLSSARVYTCELELSRDTSRHQIRLEMRGLTWGREIRLLVDGNQVYYRYVGFFNPFGSCEYCMAVEPQLEIRFYVKFYFLFGVGGFWVNGRRVAGLNGDTTPRSHDLPQETEKGSGKATASLIMGLVSAVTWLIPLFGVPTTVAGIVLGILGLGPQRRTRAIFGIVLSLIFLVITIIAEMALRAHREAIAQHPPARGPG
jgi:hypothetical protein